MIPATSGNIFHLPEFLASGDWPEEWFEPLLQWGQVRLERIISTGQTTPAGRWYDQSEDEWVVLLQGQATLAYADGTQVQLTAGDYLWIPAHRQHRVAFTSTQPACIWLAIHGSNQCT